MGNLVIRPNADGQYTAWSGFPGTPLYSQIDEADADGDTSYVWASSASAFTVRLSDTSAGSWPRATRIPSIRVVATVRTTGVSSTVKFRLRALSQDFDSEDFVVTSGYYAEISRTYHALPNGNAWNVPLVNRTEAGLVFVSGDTIRCTKLEVFVHEEIFPHYTITPEGAGNYAEWVNVPGVGPDYLTVSGIYDGDRSYLSSAVAADRHTFVTSDIDATPSPPTIDRVVVKALVKNVGATANKATPILRSAGFDFLGGTATDGHTVFPDGEWHLLSEEFLNDPNIAWPSGNPAGTAWTSTQVNAIEIGVENHDGGDLRCTSIAAEVWLEPDTLTTGNYYPADDGYHQDWSTVVPGPNAWDAVDEDPPDNATSYVILDADTAGTAQYASFALFGAGSPGGRIFNVELRYRVRLGPIPHGSMEIAPVFRLGGETYVGSVKRVEGTGATWFDVKWDFHTDPITGGYWDFANVGSAEYGLVCTSGSVWLSRVRVQAQGITDYTGVSAANTIDTTNAADTLMTRSIGDGTIYAITEFAIGSTGFVTANPEQVTAVNPALTSLGNEVYRGPIDRVQYDANSPNWTVTYWCRVPQAAYRGTVGELGLFATILWSPIPAEIGTQFLFAVVHHPCHVRHEDDVSLYVVTLDY